MDIDENMKNIMKKKDIKKDIRKFYLLAAKYGFKEGNPVLEDFYKMLAQFKYGAIDQ